MDEYMDGFKPAEPEDLEKYGDGAYGKNTRIMREFMESGEKCVLKVFETREEARKVRNGLNTTICNYWRGKAAVSISGKAVMIERL